MEYSIQELSRLSGVTTRTLRWYDQIDLLKPARVADSGYRYYGPAEVDRLQDILFYRALGVELARIRACLDDPAFDRLTTLRSHLHALEAQRTQLEKLIRSVRKTIDCEERNEMMNDQQKFEAFKAKTAEQYEQTYGAEARAKYDDAQVDATKQTLLHLTPEQYEEWTALGETICSQLEEAVAAQLMPQGEAGENIVRLHRRWLTLTGTTYDAAKHRGIAELYVMDARFTAYYDRHREGCARFLRDAVAYWAK